MEMIFNILIQLDYITKRLTKVFLSWLIVSLSLLSSCSDPVASEFKYKEGLVYIEGLATNVEGVSYVSIFVSKEEFGLNKNVFVKGATVSFINSATGTQVNLTEEGELYVPPSNFIANIGETWELSVLLPDGKQYRSEVETLTNPVDITQVDVEYSAELLYSVEFNSFVPGHSIFVSFNDPPEKENFYYWRFRSFEKLIYCKIGEKFPYNLFNCEEDCWRVRYGDKIQIFADKFTNGNTINKLPVADIFLYTKDRILVEMQQFSLSPKAYEYYKVLKDLVDNNSGFNAPLPSAFIGNVFNPDDKNEYVLGRFTVAPASISQILIDRSDIIENALEPRLIGNSEPVLPAACEEGRFRTGKRPVGWQD